jgi:5-formyltetrahydrofolate cyclo-ligase
MTKQQARTEFLQRRMLLTDREWNRLNALILIHFQRLPLPPLHLVHAYVAMLQRKEPDTEPLIRYLQLRHPALQIAVPRVEGNELVQVRLTETLQLLPNKWGVTEPVGGEPVAPEDTDLVLTPLLAFDQQGYRVGYGKGYYDRFLARCRPDVITVGLSFFEPVPRIADTNEYDIPLNYCITPQQIYEFG